MTASAYFVLFALPLLVLAAAVVGYFFTNMKEDDQ